MKRGSNIINKNVTSCIACRQPISRDPLSAVSYNDLLVPKAIHDLTLNLDFSSEKEENRSSYYSPRKGRRHLDNRSASSSVACCSAACHMPSNHIALPARDPWGIGCRLPALDTLPKPRWIRYQGPDFRKILWGFYNLKLWKVCDHNFVKTLDYYSFGEM